MAKEKENMFSSFDTAAQARQQEQQKIEAAVTGSQVPENLGRLKKRGDGATTITLTISREDKARVKILAAKRGLAVSDLLHQWITESCREGDNKP